MQQFAYSLHRVPQGHHNAGLARLHPGSSAGCTGQHMCLLARCCLCLWSAGLHDSSRGGLSEGHTRHLSAGSRCSSHSLSTCERVLCVLMPDSWVASCCLYCRRLLLLGHTVRGAHRHCWPECHHGAAGQPGGPHRGDARHLGGRLRGGGQDTAREADGPAAHAGGRHGARAARAVRQRVHARRRLGGAQRGVQRARAVAGVYAAGGVFHQCCELHPWCGVHHLHLVLHEQRRLQGNQQGHRDHAHHPRA